MTNLSKSLKNLFKSLKKSSDVLNFPSGKEYEGKLSEEGDIDSDAAEKLGQIQENEHKYQYMTGDGEHDGQPVNILDTRMMGSPNRLRALIEYEDGRRNIVQIHRIKNVKLTGNSIE